MPWTLSGFVIATDSTPSVNAKGIAPTRSSTLSGMSFVASGLIPTTARSTSGIRNFAASSRAVSMSPPPPASADANCASG